jgi:hypothetical protein
MTLSKICALLFVTLSLPAAAATNFDQLGQLGQAEFTLLSKDFISAASYKAVSPAEPLGITGFDLGVELSVSQLQNSAIWKKAGADISVLPLPKLHIHKGLPFNIDVGASLTVVPDSDIRLLGAEVRYAFLEGGVATPALAIRGAVTRLSGVNQLDLSTQSIELTASKGFVMFTPFIGVGKVWGDVRPHVGSLQKESSSVNKLFAGINANFGLVNVAGEVDRTGENQSVSIKLGLRW